MRQQTPVSRVLPFSFNYQGNHPAGIWLMHALQKHHFHLNPPLFTDALPVFYALDHSFLKALGEPVLSFPLEWCEQSFRGQVIYSRQALDWIVTDSLSIEMECLDIQRFMHHINEAFKHYIPPEIPTSDQTQPLSLVWKLLDAAPANKASEVDRWCVSGELQGAFASYGILHNYVSDVVKGYFCYRPATQTTFFTVEIIAQNPEQAREKLLENYPFMASFMKCGVDSNVLSLDKFKSAAIFWPKISFQGTQITIVSQRSDIRPMSLMLEGYCWGIMAHLFCFLNARYTSPEAVFQRLQHFDQKVRRVLSPFSKAKDFHC